MVFNALHPWHLLPTLVIVPLLLSGGVIPTTHWTGRAGAMGHGLPGARRKSAEG